MGAVFGFREMGYVESLDGMGVTMVLTPLRLGDILECKTFM